jgi:hypothetical protein
VKTLLVIIHFLLHHQLAKSFGTLGIEGVTGTEGCNLALDTTTDQ